MQQSIKGSREDKLRGKAKEISFVLNIGKMTLCGRCKLSSIIWPSILPSESVFSAPCSVNFHRGYGSKKWLKLRTHLSPLKTISLNSYRDSRAVLDNAAPLPPPGCTASICRFNAALKILKNLNCDYVVVFFFKEAFLYIRRKKKWHWWLSGPYCYGFTSTWDSSTVIDSHRCDRAWSVIVPPLPKCFLWALAKWECEIKPEDLGTVPSGTGTSTMLWDVTWTRDKLSDAAFVSCVILL